MGVVTASLFRSSSFKLHGGTPYVTRVLLSYLIGYSSIYSYLPILLLPTVFTHKSLHHSPCPPLPPLSCLIPSLKLPRLQDLHVRRHPRTHDRSQGGRWLRYSGCAHRRRRHRATYCVVCVYRPTSGSVVQGHRVLSALDVEDFGTVSHMSVRVCCLVLQDMIEDMGARYQDERMRTGGLEDRS
jgi:hypothetical protein